MATLHIVQSEDSGIPDTPQVFLDEEAAALAYVQLWREAYRLKDGEELPEDYDKEWAGGGERGVRWWTIDAPEKSDARDPYNGTGTQHVIPVAFEVYAETEDEAASILARALQPVNGGRVESWQMPNHQHIDGSDSDERLVWEAAK